MHCPMPSGDFICIHVHVLVLKIWVSGMQESNLLHAVLMDRIISSLFPG